MKKEWEKYKDYDLEKEKCDEYISELSERKVNLIKSIVIVSIAAFVLLSYAICYDNIITLILGLIQGVRAFIGLSGVEELNNRIEYLNEVKKGMEKADGYQ